MSYAIELYPDARDQITALPGEALLPMAEVMAMLELTPWNGAPLNRDNPDGAVRTLPFGRFGLITYLILDGQRRVDVLNVVWPG
ncbi:MULTISPECIES: hypothetical protein [unclassified Pseudonocardia]|uniref:hypothetical protein n=1 Tax=unclassified Pseudonocardia TaxID=2619320 RepID=UPI000963782A|nr:MULTISPECIES: hypothetical protein [unclassified Pseudonocardia]MBN9096690.1 hypothetical protein [Pseudonocardia sp.]OJY46350.1 MAG: hypothetical protein BGP03_26950 [Pseudonocardia sp. 73-21]